MMLVLASSCEKFLDKSPLDSLTAEQAFADESSLQRYIYSLYQNNIPTALQIYGNAGVYEQMFVIGDNISDITASNIMNVFIIEGGWNSNKELWWTWTELRRINYFLVNYQNANATQAKKNHYAGIARFFRAWFYFDKVKRYGDVPWYNKPLGSQDPDLYKARDPRTLVMDSVLADINFAVKNIEDTKDNSCSLVTKWVALALKSRICLFEGTFRKYHTELGLSNTANSWLQNASDAANEIMTSGKYKLYSTNTPDKDYRALFINESPKSDEIILAAVYNNTLEKWHGATSFFSNFGKYQESFTKRFVNTYLNIDGSRFTDAAGYDTVQFQREVKNRDKRLAQTIRTPFYKRSDGTVPSPYLASALSGYQILKFSLDDPYYDQIDRCSNAIPLIRYAEVLLNYAEAKAELGSFTETEWNATIGLLRKRAGITNTAMPATLDTYMTNNFYEDLNSIPIVEIRRERAVELAAEAFRMDDLKRWKKGSLLEIVQDGIYCTGLNELQDLNGDGKPDVSFVTVKPSTPVTGVYYCIVDNNSVKLSEGNKGRLLLQCNIVKKFKDSRYYAPIPHNELLINPNLIQTEGWD